VLFEGICTKALLQSHKEAIKGLDLSQRHFAKPPKVPAAGKKPSVAFGCAPTCLTPCLLPSSPRVTRRRKPPDSESRRTHACLPRPCLLVFLALVAHLCPPYHTGSTPLTPVSHW
jgi:hypothetical protein